MSTNIAMTVSGGYSNTANRRIYFAYTQVTGDFVFTARISAISGVATSTGNSYPFGILYCEDIATASLYDGLARFQALGGYTSAITPAYTGSRWVKLARSTGASSQSRSNSTLTIGTTYLRIVRTGCVTQVFTSADGLTWTTENSSTFTGIPSDTMYVGFYAAPGGTDSITYTYDNISITQ